MDSEEIENLLYGFGQRSNEKRINHYNKHLKRICKYLVCIINNIKNYQTVSYLSYDDCESDHIIDNTICMINKLIKNAECKHNYKIVTMYKKEFRKVLDKFIKIKDGKYSTGVIYEKLETINEVLCTILAIFQKFKNDL
jgi:hypothetical protein